MKKRAHPPNEREFIVPKGHQHKHSQVEQEVKHFYKNVYFTSGELIVANEHFITFEVQTSNPENIFIGFVDEAPFPIPCVPYEEDTFEIIIENRADPYSTITISWKVSGVRKIAWCVRD